jgi:ABC-2 type transport system permease protein
VRGIKSIIKKELADHFASYRFTIIFALIAMVSLITAYMVGINIRNELEGVAKPQFVFLMLFTSSGVVFSLVQFVAFFGPLVGLVLGFDTINRERSEGTLSKLVSQPIYRDVVINGKFLAGVVLITVMMVSILLVITGLGLIVLGIIPGFEEIWRIFIYLLVSIIYISFWLGVAILFSIFAAQPLRPWPHWPSGSFSHFLFLWVPVCWPMPWHRSRQISVRRRLSDAPKW